MALRRVYLDFQSEMFGVQSVSHTIPQTLPAPRVEGLDFPKKLLFLFFGKS